MPHYEFRCRECGDTFVEQRKMVDSAEPATCPQGHGDTVRLLSTVAFSGRASTTASTTSTAGPSGGCCGGGCCA
jgi:putative FmdB family regulatory protein